MSKGGAACFATCRHKGADDLVRHSALLARGRHVPVSVCRGLRTADETAVEEAAEDVAALIVVDESQGGINGWGRKKSLRRRYPALGPGVLDLRDFGTGTEGGGGGGLRELVRAR